jgi:hypothetical protein
MQLLKDPKGEEKGYQKAWMENADPNRKNVMVVPQFQSFLRKLHRESPFGLDLSTTVTLQKELAVIPFNASMTE